MAVYCKKFENIYEKNLITEIIGKETVEVTGTTNLKYKNGLTIDASGKTIYRKAADYKFDSDNRTLSYNSITDIADFQGGFATLNLQIAGLNVAKSRTWKTETSTSYNLRGLLFANPSPIKLERQGAVKVNNISIKQDMQILYLGKGGAVKLLEKVAGRAMFGLCMVGV